MIINYRAGSQPKFTVLQKQRFLLLDKINIMYNGYKCLRIQNIITYTVNTYRYKPINLGDSRAVYGVINHLGNR